MTKIIVFDLDGTLADLQHRIGYIENKPKNWKAFHAAVKHDTPIEPIIFLYKLIEDSVERVVEDVRLIICSGRGAESRADTEAWLDRHGIYYEQLMMRPVNDHRPDYIIKKEMLDNIIAQYGTKPWLVFDDRNQVVDMWRENGIQVCQVAPGDF